MSLKYFWYHRPQDGFPPPTVVRPDDWTPSDRLCLMCTQTDLPAREQRELVDEWCRILPTLEGVRYLWLNSKTPQRLFDAACAAPGLRGLWVKWSGVASIAAIASMDGLEAFHLGSSTRVESIDPLAGSTRLRWLGLENLKRIDDVSPLASLTGLEGLSLEGSLWTTQRVRTLRPLAALTGLRYLTLGNLRSADATLAALYTLTNLETLVLPTWWPEDEVAELRRRNPRLGE